MSESYKQPVEGRFVDATTDTLSRINTDDEEQQSEDSDIELTYLIMIFRTTVDSGCLAHLVT